MEVLGNTTQAYATGTVTPPGIYNKHKSSILVNVTSVMGKFHVPG